MDPLHILDNMWIAPVDLMNVLWSMQPNQWAHKIHNFFKWLDWKDF
jgi:hypothetical protein